MSLLHYIRIVVERAYGGGDSLSQNASAQAFFDKAIKQDDSGAVASFTLALEKDPLFSAAYYGRGQKYYKLGHFDLALADAIRATELAPKKAEYYELCGNILSAKARHRPQMLVKTLEAIPVEYHQAIDFFTKSIALNPMRADSYIGRSLAYGDFVLADMCEKVDRGYAILKRSDFDKARELEPNNRIIKILESERGIVDKTFEEWNERRKQNECDLKIQRVVLDFIAIVQEGVKVACNGAKIARVELVLCLYCAGVVDAASQYYRLNDKQYVALLKNVFDSLCMSGDLKERIFVFHQKQQLHHKGYKVILDGGQAFCDFLKGNKTAPLAAGNAIRGFVTDLDFSEVLG